MSENVLERCLQVEERFARAKTCTSSHGVLYVFEKAETRRVDFVVEYFQLVIYANLAFDCFFYFCFFALRVRFEIWLEHF